MNKLILLLFLLPLTALAQEDPPFGCGDTCKLFIPNTLTPDCDNANCDDFQVISNCPLTDFSLKIYDRWGETVFETNDIKTIWHGTDKDDHMVNDMG